MCPEQFVFQQIKIVKDKIVSKGFIFFNDFS